MKTTKIEIKFAHLEYPYHTYSYIKIYRNNRYRFFYYTTKRMKQLRKLLGKPQKKTDMLCHYLIWKSDDESTNIRG